MLSIFASPEEAKAFGKANGCGTPRRPLQPKTLERIARGLVKFVLQAKRPFIVRTDMVQSNSGCAYDIASPLTTVTSATGHAVVDATVAPFIGQLAHGGGGTFGESRANSVNAPLGTVHAGGNNHALVGATVAPYTAGVGGRAGQSPATSVEAPMPTVTGKADRVVCAATLQTLNHAGPEHRAQSPAEPLHTVTSTRDARALVSALITKHYGGVVGKAADEPHDTVTGTDHNAVTCAYLSHFYTSNTAGGQGDPRQPAKTITSGGQHAAVTVALLEQKHEEDRSPAAHPDRRPDEQPLLQPQSAGLDATVGEGAGDHEATATGVGPGGEAVASSASEDGIAAPFLVGAGGAAYAGKPKPIDEPANTVMVNDRRALVAAFMSTYYGNTQDGNAIDGQTYVVTDIAVRMLTPRELARAQGFDDSYVIEREADGSPVTKADQVKLIGNSVPPAFARAIVKANVVDQGVLDEQPQAAGVDCA